MEEGLVMNLVKKRYDVSINKFVDDPKSARSTISTLPSELETQLQKAIAHFYRLPSDFHKPASHTDVNFKYTMNSYHVKECRDEFCHNMLNHIVKEDDDRRRCLYQFIPSSLVNDDSDTVAAEPMLYSKIFTSNGINYKKLWLYEEHMVKIYSAVFQIKQINKHQGGLAFNIEFLKPVVYFPGTSIQLPDYEVRNDKFRQFFQAYESIQGGMVNIPSESSFSLTAALENAPEYEYDDERNNNKIIEKSITNTFEIESQAILKDLTHDDGDDDDDDDLFPATQRKQQLPPPSSPNKRSITSSKKGAQSNSNPREFSASSPRSSSTLNLSAQVRQREPSTPRRIERFAQIENLYSVIDQKHRANTHKRPRNN